MSSSDSAMAASESVSEEGPVERKRRRLSPGGESDSLHLGLEEHGSYLNLLENLQNADKPKAMVQLVADFVVEDAPGQCFVDSVRRRLDSFEIRSADGKMTWPFVTKAMLSRNLDLVRLLLSAGLNPDVPNGRSLRPSHYCGVLARVDFAALIFPCRPCMSATCFEKITPLKAASQGVKVEDDSEHPQRKALRKDVEKYIKQGGFENRFPTLPELAVRKMWFAVKNLIRRQVVAESEFTEKVEDKTAEEWAEFYQQFDVAKEIRHYSTALSTRYEEAAKQMTTMAEELRECRNMDDENTQLREQVKQLQDESAAKDAKIEELSETVCVFRSKLEEAGVDSGAEEAADERG